MLYYAPAGTSIEDLSTWTPLGVAEPFELPYVPTDPLDEVDLAPLPFAGRTFSASVTFPLADFNPYGYWVLFRRRHPRVAAMHRAYRRKTRRR